MQALWYDEMTDIIPLMLNGIKVITHPLAVETIVTFKVARHPIQKRRRNWHVVRLVNVQPCAYMVGDVMYAHPDLVQKLKMQAS